MRVGIDLLYLLPGVVGGTETYANGLLRGLSALDGDEEYVVFLNRESAEIPLPDSDRMVRVVCPVQAQNRWKRYSYTQTTFPRLLHARAVDVVHSLGYVAPLWSRCPRVVTIPDVNYEAFGDRMPFPRREVLRVLVPFSARRSWSVITISNFAKCEIIRHMGIPADRIAVTYLAAEERLRAEPTDQRVQSLRERFDIGGSFVVVFGGVDRPNKNIAAAIRAFETARARYRLDHQLVVIGHRPIDRHTVEVLERSISAGSVRATGYLTDEDRDTLLATSRFLIFPSVYEGFGLPILEAMTLGTPVACSNAGPLPEVAGEAAIYFNPLSVEDMAEAIGRVARDTELRNRLSLMGKEQARQFSWTRTAEETRKIYHSCGEYQ